MSFAIGSHHHFFLQAVKQSPIKGLSEQTKKKLD
jgi:hypothetical protein